MKGCGHFGTVKDRTILAIVGMFLIFGLDGIALFNGIDGTVLILSVGAIAGLGGYEIAKAAGKEASPRTKS